MCFHRSAGDMPAVFCPFIFKLVAHSSAEMTSGCGPQRYIHNGIVDLNEEVRIMRPSSMSQAAQGDTEGA